MDVASKLSALRIKANIIADDVLGLMDVEVDVKDHVAVLRGQVQTDAQKQRAENLAYNIEEIDEVINEIQVVESKQTPVDAHFGYSLIQTDPSEIPYAVPGPISTLVASEQFAGEFTDEQIEKAVRDKLARQSVVDASDVKVKSTNQIVYLQGSIKGDANQLQDIALSVRGVMGVYSNLSEDEIAGGI